MTNLLTETLDALKQNGKSPADVLWIGAKRGYWKNEGSQVGDWRTFAELANFDYDAGFGGNEIAGSLVIVEQDWWLERGEYDGSEWWDFKAIPKRSWFTDPTGLTNLKRES